MLNLPGFPVDTLLSTVPPTVLLLQVLGIDQDNVKAYYRLGCAQTALGAWKDASKSLKRCLELDSRC